MPGISRAQRAAHRELLARLAGEIGKTGEPGPRLACALRSLPWTAGWLAVRPRGRVRGLRVHCVTADGATAFLTSTGNLIGTADMPAAARATAAAVPGTPPGR